MEIAASAKVKLRSEKIFEVRSKLDRCWVTKPAVISFQTFQIGGDQNLAAEVWSAVRVVLEFCPKLFTSLMAFA
jgi:hypothetical protein